MLVAAVVAAAEAARSHTAADSRIPAGRLVRLRAAADNLAAVVGPAAVHSLATVRTPAAAERTARRSAGIVTRQSAAGSALAPRNRTAVLPRPELAAAVRQFEQSRARSPEKRRRRGRATSSAASSNAITLASASSATSRHRRRAASFVGARRLSSILSKPGRRDFAPAAHGCGAGNFATGRVERGKARQFPVRLRRESRRSLEPSQ